MTAPGGLVAAVHTHHMNTHCMCPCLHPVYMAAPLHRTSVSSKITCPASSLPVKPWGCLMRFGMRLVLWLSTLETGRSEYTASTQRAHAHTRTHTYTRTHTCHTHTTYTTHTHTHMHTHTRTPHTTHTHAYTHTHTTHTHTTHTTHTHTTHTTHTHARAHTHKCAGLLFPGLQISF